MVFNFVGLADINVQCLDPLFYEWLQIDVQSLPSSPVTYKLHYFYKEKFLHLLLGYLVGPILKERTLFS